MTPKPKPFLNDMANFKSKAVTLSVPAQTVYDKLSDLTNLRTLLDKVPAGQVPEEQRQLLQSIELTPDSITVPGGPVGSMTLLMTEKEAPTLIKMEAENSPVPLNLYLHIDPQGAESCSAFVDIDIDIPAMLKPMVSGPLQKMADQFGQMLQAFNFA